MALWRRYVVTKSDRFMDVRGVFKIGHCASLTRQMSHDAVVNIFSVLFGASSSTLATAMNHFAANCARNVYF